MGAAIEKVIECKICTGSESPIHKDISTMRDYEKDAVIIENNLIGINMLDRDDTNEEKAVVSGLNGNTNYQILVSGNDVSENNHKKEHKDEEHVSTPLTPKTWQRERMNKINDMVEELPADYCDDDIVQSIQAQYSKEYDSDNESVSSNYSDLSDAAKQEIVERKEDLHIEKRKSLKNKTTIKAKIEQLREEIACYEEINGTLDKGKSVKKHKKKGHLQVNSNLFRQASEGKWTEEDIQGKKDELKRQMVYLMKLEKQASQKKLNQGNNDDNN